MLNRFNIRTLVIVFAVLFVLVSFVWMMDAKKSERTFKTDLVTLDTALVDKITVYPKDGSGPASVVRKASGQWLVKWSDKEAAADMPTVNQMLADLQSITAKSMVAKNPDKWAEYEVTDTTGVRVEVFSGSEKLSDFYVGKFAYRQIPQAGGQGGYQQPNFQMSTYVRLTDEEEVYKVEGFLSMTFNKNTDALRNKTILSINKEDITKVQYLSADSSWLLLKQDSVWTINELPADESAVNQYLQSIARLQGQGFRDDVNVGSLSQATQSIRIEGSNMQMQEIRMFADGSLTCTQNQGAVLDATGVSDKLFTTPDRFVLIESEPAVQ